MTVSIDREGDLAIVTVDNPPVNALGQALRQGLWDAVGALDDDGTVRAVVLICAGRTFIAGADVTEFGKPPVPPYLPDLVDRIEAASKPWIAAIHGAALGGGFEVAMGCRFRVALDTASVGLPEVTLGIVPGASGTVRTPRLAGVEAAVDLVTSGRPVKAPRAQALGLVDAVVTGDLRAGAVDFARTRLTAALPAPVSARPVTAPDPDWWEKRRTVLSDRAPGEIAPLRALDCLRVAVEQPFAQAMAHERATFLALRGSRQAAALRHVFFAERAAPRPAHLADIAPLPLRSAAVFGGGTFADDVVAILRKAGVAVADQGDRTIIYQSNEATVGQGRLEDADMIIAAFEPEAAPPADFWQGVARSCRADAILITGARDMGPRPFPADLPHPERCISLHFAPGGTLVEIIPTPFTAAPTLATAFALVRAAGRIPVQSGSGAEFIGSRLARRCREEVAALRAGGVSAATIHEALRAAGFAADRILTSPAGDDPHAWSADIGSRLIAALADEGRTLLAEGIALRPSDVDLVAIHGLGFPRWCGGPMFDADRG